MKAAIGNITLHQMTLNPKSKSLHSQLNTSKAEITAIISNLSCILCRRYHITQVTVHYGMSFPSSTFQRKTMGCKVLKKYKHFLSQAENITDGWFKMADRVEDPSTSHRWIGHKAVHTKKGYLLSQTEDKSCWWLVGHWLKRSRRGAESRQSDLTELQISWD